MKFTRGDDPEVVIDAERDGEHWRFEIRDNGIGMDPESSKRIFEPFRRLHGEEAYPGTGIGLAVCERIVEQHGGRIWVSSVAGEGSVFSFTLPAGELAEDAGRRSAKRPSRRAADAAPRLDRTADRRARARAGGCGGGDGDSPKTTADHEPLRIGTKNFTESEILGELYKQALEAKGVPVELQSAVGPTEVINTALRDGLLDMYPEYMGVLLSEVDKIVDRPDERERRLRARQADRGAREFTLLDQTRLTNENALAVKQSFSARAQVTSISDLKACARREARAAAPEFLTRFEGMIGLRQRYGLRTLKTTLADPNTACATRPWRAARSTSPRSSRPTASSRTTATCCSRIRAGIFAKQSRAPIISRAALDAARPGARHDDQRRQRAADDGRHARAERQGASTSRRRRRSRASSCASTA